MARVCFIPHRAEQIETSRRRHAEVWPETPPREAMAAREVDGRWQAELAEPFGGDGPPGEGLVALERVFDRDARRAAGHDADGAAPNGVDPTVGAGYRESETFHCGWDAGLGRRGRREHADDDVGWR